MHEFDIIGYSNWTEPDLMIVVAWFEEQESLMEFTHLHTFY